MQFLMKFLTKMYHFRRPSCLMQSNKLPTSLSFLFPRIGFQHHPYTVPHIHPYTHTFTLTLTLTLPTRST